MEMLLMRQLGKPSCPLSLRESRALRPGEGKQVFHLIRHETPNETNPPRPLPRPTLPRGRVMSQAMGIYLIELPTH